MKTETKHTPWYGQGYGKTLDNENPYVICDAGGTPVANCRTREARSEIVRAVNNFEALLTDAIVNAEWFEREGYKTEAANIRRLITKATEGI